MSTTIKIKCIDQTLTYEGTPIVASGGVNEDYVQFEFCSQWDGYSKVAVFYQNKGEIYYSLVSTDDIAVIPKEAMSKHGTMYLGVLGVKDNVTRTSEVLEYRIENGALDGFTPVEPTPEIYQQILTELQTIRDLSAETLSKEQAFEKAITEQQNSYESDLNNQWDTYKTDLTKQQTDYESKITNQQTEYETKITKQQNDYETKINSEFDEYKESIPSIAISAIENVIVAQELTLGTSWAQDTTNGYYTQTVSMSSIKSTDTPVLDVKLTGTADNIKTLSKEWSNILKAETLDGSIKFYAKKATSTALTVLVKVG